MAGEKQTEILSVNGKPSEYRSLNILSAMSAFVNIFFLFYYTYVLRLCGSQIKRLDALSVSVRVLKIKWAFACFNLSKTERRMP